MLEERVALRSKNCLRSSQQRRDPVRLVTIKPPGQLDECIDSPLAGYGTNLERHNGRENTCTTTRRIRQGPRARTARAAEDGTRARRPALLPGVGGPDAARRGDGGQAPGHARLEQLPGADRRRARQTGRARRARTGTAPASPAPAFLNGTIELHMELERELAEWLDTEAALVFTTGHQANVGALGTILGPGRHRDRRLRRPRVDPRRLPPLPRQAQGLPAQPGRPARADASRPRPRRAAASWSSSTACSRWRATSPL